MDRADMTRFEIHLLGFDGQLCLSRAWGATRSHSGATCTIASIRNLMSRAATDQRVPLEVVTPDTGTGLAGRYDLWSIPAGRDDVRGIPTSLMS